MRRFTLLGVIVLLALAGCTTPTEQPSPQASPELPEKTATNDSPAETPTTATDRETKPGPAGLDSSLYGLVQSENRTRYAMENDLELRNDSVLVTVELREGRTIPTEIDADVQARAGSTVDAYVAFDQLTTLAEHRNTTTVTAPERPEPLAAVDGSTN